MPLSNYDAIRGQGKQSDYKTGHTSTSADSVDLVVGRGGGGEQETVEAQVVDIRWHGKCQNMRIYRLLSDGR